MPTPGSHAYDADRSRLRRHLEDQGIHDERANEAANKAVKDRSKGPSPAAASDRARGPYGERGGGGDPGAVIELRSPAFSDNSTFPPRFTKTGDNVSPPLEWGSPPPDTVELLLLCDDPDAPGGTFTHWLLTGIPAGVTSIEEGTTPSGATAWPNSFGNEGWDGPMPPVGDDPHRYFFRLYALKSPLGLSPGTPVDAVVKEAEAKHLATGTLVGLFVR